MLRILTLNSDSSKLVVRQHHLDCGVLFKLKILHSSLSLSASVFSAFFLLHNFLSPQTKSKHGVKTKVHVEPKTSERYKINEV